MERRDKSSVEEFLPELQRHVELTREQAQSWRPVRSVALVSNFVSGDSRGFCVHTYLAGQTIWNSAPYRMEVVRDAVTAAWSYLFRYLSLTQHWVGDT